MKDILIGIVAVKSNYIVKTKKLINQINKVVNTNFLILTDNPSDFKEYKNVIIIEYKEKIFSFHDKRIIFREGFKHSNCVLLLDADHEVREVNNFNDIDTTNLESGVYPQLLWKYPIDCSFEHFIDGKTPRVPYGIEFKKHCDFLKLNLKNVVLIQESFVLIKKNENINTFLDIWDKLSEFCNQQDIKRNQHVLGYGEGYSLGVSVNNSNLKIFESNPIVNQIIKNFKHLAWER
jgi:hypothetical protein